jgi:hypothetical protein
VSLFGGHEFLAKKKTLPQISHEASSVLYLPNDVYECGFLVDGLPTLEPLESVAVLGFV